MEDFTVFKLITKNCEEILISRTVHDKFKIYYNSKKTNVKNEFVIKNLDIADTFFAIELAMYDILLPSNEFDDVFKYSHLLGMYEDIIRQLPFLDNIEFVEFEFGFKSKTHHTILEVINNCRKFFKEKTFKIAFNIDTKLSDNRLQEFNEISIFVNLEC